MPSSTLCGICLSEVSDFVSLLDLYYGDISASLFIKNVLDVDVNNINENTMSGPAICNDCNTILHDFYKFYKMVKDAHLKCEKLIANYSKTTTNYVAKVEPIKIEYSTESLSNNNVEYDSDNADSNDFIKTTSHNEDDSVSDKETVYPFHTAFVPASEETDCDFIKRQIKSKNHKKNIPLRAVSTDVTSKVRKRKKKKLRKRKNISFKESEDDEEELLETEIELEDKKSNKLADCDVNLDGGFEDNKVLKIFHRNKTTKVSKKRLRSGKNYNSAEGLTVSRKDSIRRVKAATDAVMSKYKVEDIFLDGKCILKEEQKNEIFNYYIDMKCVECDSLFQTYKELNDHSKLEHELEAVVKCCFMSIPSFEMIERHVIYKHILNKKMPRLPRSRIPCHVCNKLVRDCSMRLHLSSHLPHNKREFQCNYCHAGFGTFGALKSHIALNHESIEVPCTDCGKVFKNIYHAAQHKRRVHNPNGNVHTCPECGKQYKDYLYYTNHVKQHYGIVERVKCSICEAVIKRTHLSSHMRAHDSKNHRQCPHCPYKGFSIWDHVKRVHEKLKTRSCGFCPRKFFTEIGLKDHISSCHTGIPEHLCEFCGATFKSLSNCHSHRKKMHPAEWALQRLERAKSMSSGDFPVCDPSMLLRNKHILHGEQAEQIMEDLQVRRKKRRKSDKTEEKQDETA